MPDSYTLVTGAGSGLGADMAQRLSSSRRLVLSSRNRGKLEAVLAKCENTQNHLIFEADYSDVTNIGDALAEFISSNGVKIGAYVHSVGMDALCPVKAFDVEMFTNMMNIGPLAASMVMKALVRKKINSDALKSVVLVSSIASMSYYKGGAAYSASKAALETIAKTAALELAPNTRVNAVAPGRVSTPMTAAFFEDEAMTRDYESATPLGLGSVSDITDAVEFLLSEKARWITGQVLVVDGGFTV